MKIKKLTLSTSNLKDQINFYQKTLGFKLLKREREYAEFQIGNSVMRFEAANESTPYHFAFNIPSFQEAEALQWLRERVEILDYENEEIIPFENWNARAIYFYDKDRNIVEFIARRNLGFQEITPFTADSVVEISEIGLPVEDIVPLHDHLQSEMGISVYSGSTERFCAMGDERGLFIIVNTNKKDFWFPTDDTPLAADFKMTIYNNGQLFNVTFRNQNLFSHELKSNHYSFHELA
ncbi:MAG: VOC family protein [Bacteroidetes bacterium]|nr:MAG: VOC family protein [Bacteroidota bacterium]